MRAIRKKRKKEFFSLCSRLFHFFEKIVSKLSSRMTQSLSIRSGSSSPSPSPRCLFGSHASPHVGDADAGVMEVDERPETRSDGVGATLRASSAAADRNDVGDDFNLDDSLDGEDRENQVPPHLATQIVAMEREDAGFVDGERERQKEQQQQRRQLFEPAPQPSPSTSPLPASPAPPPASSPLPALSAEQRAALAAIDSGCNVFVTGAAGTGKSVLLRAAIELLRRKLDVGEGGEEEEGRRPSSPSPCSSSSVAVVAPTGVAAAAVGGSTIHAFAGCGLARNSSDLDRMRRGFPGERWRRARALVVDEVSMLSGEFLSELDAAARFARGEPRRSFGGIQLVMVGDFAQLAPVSSSSYSGFPFRHRGLAFQSPAWRAARLAPFALTVPFRQSGSGPGQGVFLRLLAEVRVGDPSGRAMAELARRCGVGGNGGGSSIRPPPPLAPAADGDDGGGERRRRQQPPSSAPTSSRLYCLNKDVDLENAKRLAELPGECPVSFRASDELLVTLPSSRTAADDDEAGAARLRLSKCSFLQRDCLARGVVELKARALVMLLKNNLFSDNDCGRGGEGEDAAAAAPTSGVSSPPAPSLSAIALVNGSMGTVLGFATVRSLRRYADGFGCSSGAAAGERKRRGRAGFLGARERKRPRAAGGADDDIDDDDPSSEEEEEEGENDQDEEEDASASHQLSSWQLPRASAASALLSLSGARKWLEANSGGDDGAGDSSCDRALLPVVRFLPPPSSSSSSSSSPRARVEAVPPALFTSDVPGAGRVARTQLPLRLAWALSVHRCQGMTLDRVTVCLRGAFATGQAYVALSRARSLEGLSIELEGSDEGEGGERSVVRADPLVRRFDAAVVAAVAARRKNNNDNFKESVAALASFKCRIFGARESLAVDAVEKAANGGGSGNRAKEKRSKQKKKAAAEDDDASALPPPPPSAAEILSGIQCYSCKGWGHVVAACPLAAWARASGKGREKEKKKGKSNGGLEVGGHCRPSRRQQQRQQS